MANRKNKKMNVTMYSITRTYGGPEEGGWYYDRWDVLGSIPVASKSWKNTREAISGLSACCGEEYYGGYRGGRRIVVEKVVGSMEKPTPYYC